MPHRIVIVGAGYAGIEAALHLNRKGRKDDLEIVLIDRHSYHTLLTEIHEVAGNRVGEDSVRIPLKDIFRDTRVTVVQDEIVSYDYDARTVSSAKNAYPYEHLVIAVGSTPNYFGIKGLDTNAFPLWSLEDAVAIRDHIKDCFHKAAVEKDAVERSRLLTFVVGGAGFTGVEMVGELAIWTRALAKDNGIPYSEVRLTIVDMLDRVLPVLDEKSSRKAHHRMEKMGVEIQLKTGIKELTCDYVDLGDDRIQTRTLIWAAGVCAAPDVAHMGLPTVAARRIEVDSFCRTGKPGVYAIGDVGGLAPAAGKKPYAAMVETALQTGDGVADNILAAIRGKEPTKVEVKFHGIMVCIGNYHAVSDIMGFRLPSWLSLTMKILVNCHYLYGIRGAAGVWTYLHDEILFRRQRETFLQKHYTKMQPAWWGAPLRVFLGAMWLYEGIQKIVQGWFVDPKLASFLGMAVGGADTTGSASQGGGSGVVDTVAKYADILNVNILGLVHGTLVKESLVGTVTQAVQGDPRMIFKVLFFHYGNFDLVHWLLQNIVLATDGLAMFFQVLVVVFEVLVGLMLLGGMFTFLGSLISFALMAMFITSTGIYDSTWWMVFASIACMGGVGRAFGLDAYVLPYLTRVWENVRKNKTLRLTFFKKRGA